jgi:hypothetical protein
MNRRPDNENRHTLYFVPSEEAPFYLAGGWRVAEDIFGRPIYDARSTALVEPRATLEARR